MFGKKIKVICIICLITVIFSTVFTACENSGTNAGETTSVKATTTTTTTAEATEIDPYEPVEGKMYTISWAGMASAPVDENSEMEQYWEKKFNVNIDFIFLDPNARDDLLAVKLASGEIPDIFSTLQARYNELIDQSMLASIPEEAFQKLAPTIYKQTSEVGKIMLVGGKIYGLANIGGHNQFRTPVVWRDDWLKNVGVDKIPETLAEAEAAFYKFTNEDPDKNSKNDTYGLSTTGLKMIFGAYGYIPTYSTAWGESMWSEKDGNLVYGSIQPEIKEALALLNKWYKDGVLDPEFLGSENKGGYWAISDSFINNRIGLTCMGGYYHWKPPLYEGDFVGQDHDTFNKVNPQGSYAFGVPVKGPAGKSGIVSYSMLDVITVLGKQVELEPDKIGKILQMAEYMDGSIEGYVTRYYGIEGKHYEMKDGKPVSIGKFSDFTELSKVGGHAIFQLASTADAIFVGYSGWDKWAKDNKFDIGGSASALPISTPAAIKYGADLLKLEQEAYIGIITGDKPIDYFDEFVSQWKANGGDEWTTEANDWYHK